MRIRAVRAYGLRALRALTCAASLRRLSAHAPALHSWPSGLPCAGSPSGLSCPPAEARASRPACPPWRARMLFARHSR
eukprot:6766978-Alexandrium_andersonii.AAC.1